MQHIVKSKQERKQFGKGSRKAQTGIFSSEEMGEQGRAGAQSTKAPASNISFLGGLPWMSLALILLQPWLEKAICPSWKLQSESIESSYQPSTTTFSTNPHPKVSWTLPGVVTPPLPWTSCSNALQPFPWIFFPNIQLKVPLAQPGRPFPLVTWGRDRPHWPHLPSPKAPKQPADAFGMFRRPQVGGIAIVVPQKHPKGQTIPKGHLQSKAGTALCLTPPINPGCLNEDQSGFTYRHNFVIKQWKTALWLSYPFINNKSTTKWYHSSVSRTFKDHQEQVTSLSLERTASVLRK